MAVSVFTSPAWAGDREDCTGTGDAAIAACTRAIDAGGTSGHGLAVLYVARGSAYLRQLEHSRALADFNAAIKIDPKNAAAYRGRGEVFALRPQIALPDLDTAIRLDPNDVQAYIDRGAAYRATGQPDRALADFDAAIRRDANAARAYAGRGRTLRDKGELDRAIADYDAAIRLDPQDHFVYLDRGIVHQAKGEIDQAIADYDTAIRLGPFTRAYELRGSAYRAKGDLGRAMADLDEAIRRDPNDAAAFRERALVRQAKGDADGAAADLAAARSLTTIIGLPIPAFTLLHIAIGFLAIVSGVLALLGLLRGSFQRFPSAVFLAAAALTAITGVLFHGARLSPAFTAGLISLAAVAIAFLALAVGRRAGRFVGHWRWIYVLAAVGALYLDVHIGAIQTLIGMPPMLLALLPRTVDWPFIDIEIGIAAVFLVLLILALARYRPRASAAG